ncbi:hypothetical protein L7F22_001706 [Adiantum nelumboides]|nr:hypothetical protein [Adiantum nelumboides]
MVVAGYEMSEAARAQRIGSVSVAELFQGFSKVNGLAMPNSAVTGSSTTTGATAFVQYTVCKGEQEVMNAVGLEQSLGISSLNVSINQKLQFVQSLQVSITSIVILIRARRSLGLSTVTNTALRSGVTAPGTDEELQRFFRSYGDCFISEMEQGGEYIASFTFYSMSKEQQLEVSTEIAASGMGLWGSVNASVSGVIEQVTKETNVRVEFNQYISGIQRPSLPTSEDCIDFALSFPSMDLDAPVIISFNSSGYEIIPEMTATEFRRIAHNREMLIGGSANDSTNFRGILLRVQALNNAIAQIMQIHAFYRIATEQLDPGLASVQRQADADERTLQAMIGSYFDDPLGHITIPNVNELSSLDHGTPVLSIRTTAVGETLGAPGRDPFNDVGDPMAFVQQFTQITSIAFYSGWYIDNLSVTYSRGMESITGSTTWPLSNMVVAGYEMSEAARAQRIGSVSVAELFQGFSKVNGLAMPNSAVTGSSTTTGATAFVQYTVCKGEQEVMNAVGLEQSLGISSLNVSINQKLQFVQSLQVSITSIVILIRARRSLGLSTVTNTALRSGVTAPGTDEELQRFFRSYGDCFISEMEQGGEYIASFTFYSMSKEQQLEVSTEIAASGMGLWGSVNASVSGVIEQVIKETNVRVEFNQYISGIQRPSLPTSEDCIDFALSFPSMDLDAPVIISFNSSGYEIIPEMTATEFRRIAHNREMLIGGSANDSTNFRGILLRVQALNNAIAQIMQIHAFYRIATEQLDPGLASVQRQADADERTLQAMIGSYFDDPLGHITIPNVNELSSLDHGTPVLSIRTTAVGETLGAPGRDPFNDVGDPMAFVQQFTQITSIAFYSGWYIDNLSVTYSRGMESITGSTTFNHGRVGHGTLQPILNVPRGYHVTSMSTAYWPRGVPPLEGLKLKITDGRSVSGGSFNSGTVQNTYNTPPRHSFMLGFQGRKGWFVDQLQLIYGIFHPSTWE